MRLCAQFRSSTLAKSVLISGQSAQRGVEVRGSNPLGLNDQTGKLLLSIFSWLAEIERDRAIERTVAELATAKRWGVNLDRKPKLTAADVAHARRMIDAGEETVADMARILKVGRNTLGRSLAQQNPAPSHS